MSGGIVIRTHTESEAQGISRSSVLDDVKDIYRKNMLGVSQRYIGDFTDRFEFYLNDPIRKGMLFLASEKDTGKTVGFLLVVYPDKPPRNDANLKQIAVDPAFRGRGIASALFDAAEKHILGQHADCTTLTTNTWLNPSMNMATFRLATGRGYLPSVEKGAMKDGTDMITFTKPAGDFIHPGQPDAKRRAAECVRIRQAVINGGDIYSILGVSPWTGTTAAPQQHGPKP